MNPTRRKLWWWVRGAAFTLACLLLGGVLGWWLTQNGWVAKLSHESVVPIEVLNKETTPKSIDFSLFWEVWDKLHSDYLDGNKLDNAKMVYGAIEGMTAAIGDPYTVFLPPTDNKQAKEDLNGAFEGVGIQLGYIDRQLAVIAPLEKHPAIAAGIKAGDLILHIKDELNGVDKDAIGMNLPEAVQLIRGKKGTAVTLTVLHPGAEKPVEITMTRNTIVVPSVEVEIGKVSGEKWQVTDNGNVAWLRLYRFGDQTSEQWDEAVGKISLAKINPGFKGVVLDVRNNPGGFLVGSVYVASEFVKDGVIVKQQGKYQTETYEVERMGKLIGMPVVVLVNKGSASASEIVAGALRDRVRAKLVGETTFGKGTVQDAQDLRGGAGIHITSGRWLLPSGEWISEKGLKPDVEVKLTEVEASDSAKINGKELERTDNQLVKAVEVLGE